MLKRNTREENSVAGSSVLYRYAGVLLVWLGLFASPVFAISMSPDALENSMNVLSLSADCAGENVSDHRLVCKDTLADITKSHIAGKITDKVTDTGMRQFGKVTGKLGMKSVSRAAKGAMRALGPTGKVIGSWNFGRSVGTELSDHLINPAIEQYLQKKGREESEKIRQHTELLKGNKAVASEYRELLMERGADEADAYLDKQFKAAGEPAESTYDVQDELEKRKEIKQQAESMDEDAARQRRIEREAEREMDGESPAEEGQEESENLLSKEDGDDSDTGFGTAEEPGENGDTEEETPVTPDTGTGEFDDRRSPIKDELASFGSRQIERGIRGKHESEGSVGSKEGRESAIRDNAASIIKELGIEMVSIPGGTFQMGGSVLYDDGYGYNEGYDEEYPVHGVNIRPFKIGKFEVTFDQWDTCVADGGCGGYRPDDNGWGRGNLPVINISWDHAKAFIDWLNSKTGNSYRLPTEAEWEYAARAGTTTLYPWGDDFRGNQANCAWCGSQWDGQQTAPVGSFAANAWGLHDMLGNVREWTEDCWHKDYNGAPTDGSAWTTGGDCSQRMFRGASWNDRARYLRPSDRGREGSVRQLNHTATYGFRLAQD